MPWCTNIHPPTCEAGACVGKSGLRAPCAKLVSSVTASEQHERPWMFTSPADWCQRERDAEREIRSAMDEHDRLCRTAQSDTLPHATRPHRISMHLNAAQGTARWVSYLGDRCAASRHSSMLRLSKLGLHPIGSNLRGHVLESDLFFPRNIMVLKQTRCASITTAGLTLARSG